MLEPLTEHPELPPALHARLEPLENRLLLSATAKPFAVPDREITVMSQNLYLGADIARLAAADSMIDVPGIVSEIWQIVQQTDFPTRAAVIADEIFEARPLIIGLQEAALWRIQTEGDFFAGNPVAAEQVVYDFVDILIGELADRGLHYTAVATFQGMDVELPDALPFGAYSDIRFTDRDVILARTGLPSSHLKISNAQSGQFQTVLPFSIGDATINVPRGWTSVDAKIRGKTVHIVEAHTETFYEPVNWLQIGELIDGPAVSPHPTIIMGDFNTDATVPQLGYQMLLGAGFEDVWTTTNPDDPGLTWGHQEDLRDSVPVFSQRIDFIMQRGGLEPIDMYLVDEPLTDPGNGAMWPSDHRGLVATLQIPSHVRPSTFAGSGLGASLFSRSLIGVDSIADAVLAET